MTSADRDRAVTEPRFKSLGPLVRRARWVAEAVSRSTIELIVPPVCAACAVRIGAPDALCAACWRGVQFIRPPLCDRLGVPMPFDPGGQIISAGALADPPAYDRARAATLFGPVVRRLVHAFKYHDQQHPRALFRRWLELAGQDLFPGTDVVVPVPLHRWRLLTRRFNQSALLAREVSRSQGLAADMTALVRVKRTPPQVGRTADQRRRNMAAAFAVPTTRRHRIEGRNVLLVDDVITTGATVNACARALKAAGAARVDVLALAIALDEPDAADLAAARGIL